MAEVQIGILINAVDQATAEMQKVGNSAQTMADNVETGSSRIEAANERSAVSLRSLGRSFAGLMTSATSLIFTFERMERAQYTLDRATNLLEDTNRRVAKAQDEYNKAVEKYGADSPQAAAAAATLKAAQDDASLATERLQLAQQNMNQVMITTVAMVIPTVITGITSLQGVIGAFSAFLASNPMGWLIIALSAITMLIIGLVTNFMGFRDTVIACFTAIGSAIMGIVNTIVGVLNTLFGWIKSIVDAVVGFISWLTGAAPKATAAAAGIAAGVGPTVPTTISPRVGAYQFGGIVEETGLAFLHRGEVVTPAAKASEFSSFADYSTINIYASIGSDYDVERLADKLDEIRKRKLLAYGRRSGW